MTANMIANWLIGIWAAFSFAASTVLLILAAAVFVANRWSR